MHNINMSSMIREKETTGKEYDVFFSHDGTNPDDCAWVKEMAGKLERDHKLKCAFAERDFIPGKPVLKNMTRCVKKARVMVLVLSPSFVQSGWCTYEAQVGLTDHLTREQIMVVPVMREECTKPDFIAHLTHLDKEEFVERFIKIVNSGDTSQEDMKEFSFGERVDQFNGRIITTQNSEPNRLVTSFDISETFTSLSAKGIRIEYSKLEDAFNKLGNSNKLAMWRYYWSLLIAIIFVYWVYALYKTALLCFEFQTIATSMICIILGCIGLVFSSVQISQRSVVIATEVLVNRWSDKVSIGFLHFSLMRLLFCAYLLGYVGLILNVGLTALNDHNITLPYLFSYMVIQNKLIKNGVELIKLVSIFMAYMSLPIGFSILTIRSRAIHEGRANAVFLESSIMAGLVRRGLIRRSFILAYVYFKTDKCKETLKKYLSKGNQSNRAGEYLSKTCGMYIRRLVDNSMPTPLSGQRHTKHGMCLCQMVESEYFGELV